jgi:hypothetical protein
MTNLETLVNAGVIKDASQVSPDMQTKINSLTPDEVTHLISVRAKLGDDDIQTHNNVLMI